jgi:putative transposase
MPFILRLLLLTIIGQQHRALTLHFALMRAERDYYRGLVPTGTKLAFTPAWRRTFGVLGKAVGWAELEKIATVANVRTFQRWYKLVQEAPAQLANKVGRPKVPAWVELQVLTMAYATNWGITRIAGAITNVWQKIHPKTVRRILREHHFDPDQRKLTRPESTWKPFITEHGHEIAAMDFLQTEVWGWLGKRTVYVLFLIHLATRRVEVAGITENPTAQWMKQIARNLTMADVGFLTCNKCKYLIRDNDKIYQPSFDEMLFTGGVEAKKITPNSPDLNAFAERWVRSVKTECLRHVRCIGIGGLQRALREYLLHYHGERNHQGISNVLIDPEKLVANPKVPIRCRSRLGGVLKYYYRAA